MREDVDDGIQTRELVNLEGVVEINLDQSYEKSFMAIKVKDGDRDN